MMISALKLALGASIVVACCICTIFAGDNSSKATHLSVSDFADEEEAGLFNGAASYARMNKAITICKGC